MTEREAFTRTICDEPADDVRRLVFADWLQENGEPERAEFIRVQLKIAHRSDMNCVKRYGKIRATSGPTSWHRFTKRCRCEACCLRRREYETSKRFCALDWREGIPAGSMNVYTRGFVSQVGLSCAVFMHGCLAIFRAHPVTTVTLPDKWPWQGRHSRDDPEPNRWGWWRTLDHQMQTVDEGDPEILPKEIMDTLDTDPRRVTPRGAYLYDRALGMGAVMFHDRATAVDAASVACVAVGRKLAGLLPLPVALEVAA